MVLVNDEFINYMKLGEILAEKMVLGWEVTTIINDRFGNGIFQFEKKDATTIVVPFEKMKVEDEVEISFNKLGKIQRRF